MLMLVWLLFVAVGIISIAYGTVTGFTSIGIIGLCFIFIAAWMLIKEIRNA